MEEDKSNSIPEGDPSIRSPRRATQGERKKRGGGPKTPEGKEVVRRNPIKHGVLAQTPVIPLVGERDQPSSARTPQPPLRSEVRHVPALS